MYGELLKQVGEFVETLGYTPDDCPIEALQDKDATLAVRVRAGIKDVAGFHPNIDPQLSIVKATLEEVIVYGVKDHKIKFNLGMFGVTAERGYQPKRELQDKEILRIWKQVHNDYGDMFLDNVEAMLQADGEHVLRRERVRPLVRFARRFASAWSGK